MGAHEHILTALQTMFTQAGYRTDSKNVRHSRGLKKADLAIQGFWLKGVRNGEASHADVNGVLDAAEKLDNYQHDYNARNYFFLPADDLREN
jgi:hypothetical protein